ncbi:transposase, partial [Lentilactobacillus hilgardii]|nr:transposase [Lentilactobacillus hilgardii]MCP9349859.1 transposase [Lentilactobacillus hilgardii]MCP9352745.1 transposase [Lentilactobacillus hilgardii]
MLCHNDKNQNRSFFRKYYSDEFKNNIVKLYHNENRSKKSLANEYGVHPTTISHWIKR